MRKRLATLKYLKPSIALIILAILITLLAHPHILVPIALVIGAILIAWQNYNMIRKARIRQQEEDNENLQA